MTETKCCEKCKCENCEECAAKCKDGCGCNCGCGCGCKCCQPATKK